VPEEAGAGGRAVNLTVTGRQPDLARRPPVNG
jgi:hypothetical protein